MAAPSQSGDLREGNLYRDLDGCLVKLLRILDGICCWVPVDQDWNARQYTLAEHFGARFRPFASAPSPPSNSNAENASSL